MKIIIDMPVWSLALRRHKQSTDASVVLFRELIADGRVVLLGAIRQEIISGIRHTEQYEKLKADLRALPNLKLKMEDYEIAAR